MKLGLLVHKMGFVQTEIAATVFEQQYTLYSTKGYGLSALYSNLNPVFVTILSDLNFIA